MNMKRCMLSAIMSAASSLVSLSCYSETVRTAADFQSNKKTLAYLNSPPVLATLYRLGMDQEKKFGVQSDCASPLLLKPSSVSVVSTIDFPDDQQHPTKGVWYYRYRFERCGESKFYNALFIANANGEAPMVRAEPPGSTRADPLLVRDATFPLSLGALARSGLKDCKDAEVFDMRVTEPPHDVGEGENTLKGVWKEVWTYRVCGQSVEVPVTFTPNPMRGGTLFFSESAKTRGATAK